MNVDFELYKFFYYVAKNHNITKTANELHVTQPSVSKAIKNLEEQLGCTLFIRNKYGVVDILILNIPYPIPNDFEVIPLCDLHDIFVANKDYLFLKNKDLSIKDICEYPLVLLSKGANTRYFQDDYTSSLGINLEAFF